MKSKFTYKCRGKAFYGEVMWGFGNHFAKDAVILMSITAFHLILILKKITFTIR